MAERPRSVGHVTHYNSRVVRFGVVPSSYGLPETLRRRARCCAGVSRSAWRRRQGLGRSPRRPQRQALSPASCASTFGASCVTVANRFTAYGCAAAGLFYKFGQAVCFVTAEYVMIPAIPGRRNSFRLRGRVCEGDVDALNQIKKIWRDLDYQQ